MELMAAGYHLFHVSDLVRYGSKPLWELSVRPALRSEFANRLRTFQSVVDYLPHQVFIGNQGPEDLNREPRPWFCRTNGSAPVIGKFGEILTQPDFFLLMKEADQFDLVWLEYEWLSGQEDPWRRRGWSQEGLGPLEGKLLGDINDEIDREGALPLFHEGKTVGCVRQAHEQDPNLEPTVLLENFAAKATGAFALRHLLTQQRMDPETVDVVLSCSEDAVGDRYNRGGGNLAKAIAEMAGCSNASGVDIKSFCASPGYAIVHGAALISAGIARQVAVVGGGSLPKLGMKFLGHLKNDMPILEDVLASMAFLMTGRTGEAPFIRMEAIGQHRVKAGISEQALLETLVGEPLRALGMKMLDISRFAVELHNPEITEPAGSGDVPRNNYRSLGAFAVLRKEILATEIPEFVTSRGMVGFSPTQGHIPAAVPYVGHALSRLRQGSLDHVMFVAKGSLFLGRMTQLMDGISFVLSRPE